MASVFQAVSDLAEKIVLPAYLAFGGDPLLFNVGGFEACDRAIVVFLREGEARGLEEWVYSNCPTVKLTDAGCEFLGARSEIIEECLPEQFGTGVEAVAISATRDTQTGLLLQTMEAISARGVILMGQVLYQ